MAERTDSVFQGILGYIFRSTCAKLDELMRIS